MEGRERGFEAPAGQPEAEEQRWKEGRVHESEILDLLAPLVGENGKETKRVADDEGLKKLVIEVKNEKGEIAEYTYDRQAPAGSTSGSLKSSVSVVYYDADGMPEGGKVIADYVEGTWRKQ